MAGLEPEFIVFVPPLRSMMPLVLLEATRPVHPVLHVRLPLSVIFPVA